MQKLIIEMPEVLKISHSGYREFENFFNSKMRM